MSSGALNNVQATDYTSNALRLDGQLTTSAWAEVHHIVGTCGGHIAV